MNKDLSNFYVARSGSGDGYQYECKSCLKDRLKLKPRNKDLAREYNLKYRHKNREKFNLRMKESRWKRKLMLISKYSNNTNRCACCNEDNIEFLNIDHVFGGGNKQRKELGGTYGVIKYIINNNFPDGFRVLCYNCNCSIGSFGYCPHEKNKSKTQRIYK